VQALLALHHAVFTDDDMRIAENFSGLVKANSVFHDIRAVLALVSFKAHRHPVLILVYTA
jgi:hypothetical protein